jgi:hypothetical protein
MDQEPTHAENQEEANFAEPSHELEAALALDDQEKKEPESGNFPGLSLRLAVDKKSTKEESDRESAKEKGAKTKEGRSGDILPLVEVYSQELERVQELFIPSRDYEAKRKTSRGHPVYRIWVVYGPEHSGKLTTAIKLALDLSTGAKEPSKIYCCGRMLPSSFSLIDLAHGNNDEEEENWIKAYILEDAFERNIRLEELVAPWLEPLNRELEDHKSFLVLTTKWDEKDLERLSVGKIAALPEDLDKVLASHLRRFGKHVEGVDLSDSIASVVSDRWHLLEEFLKKPVEVERFCHKLGELSPESISDEDLIRYAREAALIGRTSVRLAFRKLKVNQKLYALLVVLFPGIERSLLDEIYARAVRYLRSSGIEVLRDEREIGLDDLLEQIGARERNRLVVIGGDLEEQILLQIRNYRRLLHSLSDVLLELCVIYSAPEHWPLRRIVGAALGRLAAQEDRGLEPVSGVLEQLAVHPNGGVASVPGFVLDQMCRDAPHLRGATVLLLNSWVRSGDPDLMWAAGAAVWRVYVDHASELRDTPDGCSWLDRLLGVVAFLIRSARNLHGDRVEKADLAQREIWAGDNLRSAYFSLERIASSSPLAAAGKLREWLQGKPGDPVREVAAIACRKVLETAAGAYRGPISEYRAWTNLVDTILALDPDVAEVGDALMAALASWSHWSGEEVESDENFLELLRAANRLSGKAAKSLRAGLVRHWLTSDSKAVRSRGRALLRRSHAMEGLPLRDLRPARGVVALDASAEALAGGGERLALQLLEVVGCYMEAVPAHLGGREIPLSAGSVLADRVLRSEFPRPRLLLPPVEGGLGSRKETRLTLVLTWGPLLDLSDGEGQPWWPPLLVTVGGWTEQQDSAGEKRPADTPRQPRPVALTDDLDSVVVALAHSLNAASLLPDTEEGAATRPEEDLTALEQVEGTSSPPDRAARIVASVLNRYTTNPVACLAQVRGWLEDVDTGGLPRRVGTAVLRALLRFHETPGTFPSEEGKGDLLRLAFLLPKNDPGAARTVLETVLAWMEDSSWAERMAGGSSLAFEWMRWFEALIPHHARYLERWLNEAEQQETDSAEEAGAVWRMLRWLRFRLSLGTGGMLPVLEDGKGYGVFILDAFSRDRLQGQSLARLTVGLLEDSRLRDLPRLVFRLGQRTPLAVPGEELARESVVPAGGSRLPRLLGPILDALPAERVRFALVLSAGPALDASDWSEGPWASRIRLYGPTDGRIGPEPFIRISPPSHGADEVNPEVNAILSHLASLIEKAA